MQIEKLKIYGVDRVGGANPSLIRTDSSVGKTISVGNSEIQSDFDTCYPFSDMKNVVDSMGNVFILIPKFYSKKTPNLDGSYKLQISGCRYDGFTTLFVDGKGNELDYVCVGKYEAGYDALNGRAISKSGETANVSITISTMRTRCKANGNGYQQYDFLIDEIIRELFTIEFATTDSQSIFQGYTSESNIAALATGHTDNISTPSGSFNNNLEPLENPNYNGNGTSACKYRGIENPFGNIWKFCDGINFKDEKIYLCVSPDDYASDKFDAPYFYVGNRATSNGWVRDIEKFANFPLLGFVSNLGGNEIQYYGDYYWYNGENRVLLCGGSWAAGSRAGLYAFAGDVASSYTSSGVGGRLCYKPL